MAFQKGQSGNPGGRSKEKVMADALRAALNETDPKTQRRKLQVVAENVANSAVANEPWAINIVFDRMDGKVPQALIGDDNEDPVTVRTIVTGVPRAGDDS